MKQEEINEILAKHAAWLRGDSDGERADCRKKDMCGADMRGAYMCGADMRDADMCDADMRDAEMRGADMRGADMRGADMRGADMRGADMCGAEMDHSSGIPLWCGGAKFRCDARLIQQVCAHLVTLECDDAEWLELREKILPFARKSHRAEDLGILEGN